MPARIARVLIVVFAMVSVSLPTAQAQEPRPHDVVMKEVAPAFASLRENLDSDALADAAADATRLQGLFKEIEDFWTPFGTQDAIDLARRAQEGSEQLISAAQSGDEDATRAALSTIQGTCGSCHDSHRESFPDGSFRIKP